MQNLLHIISQPAPTHTGCSKHDYANPICAYFKFRFIRSDFVVLQTTFWKFSMCIKQITIRKVLNKRDEQLKPNGANVLVKYLAYGIHLQGVHTNLGIKHFQLAVSRIHNKHDPINCKLQNK